MIICTRLSESQIVYLKWREEGEQRGSENSREQQKKREIPFPTIFGEFFLEDLTGHWVGLVELVGLCYALVFLSALLIKFWINYIKWSNTLKQHISLWGESVQWLQNPGYLSEEMERGRKKWRNRMRCPRNFQQCKDPFSFLFNIILNSNNTHALFSSKIIPSAAQTRSKYCQNNISSFLFNKTSFVWMHVDPGCSH